MCTCGCVHGNRCHAFTGCILTTALLMQALSPEENAAAIATFLEQLCRVDPYREAYYRDLCEQQRPV